MNTKGELNILPPRYYVGQYLDPNIFSELSMGTKHEQENMLSCIKDKPIILYNIHKVDVDHANIKSLDEIQVVLIPVTPNVIDEDNWENIITALQRELPCRLIIIFSSQDDGQKYCVAVVVSMKKRDKIIDDFYLTDWMDEPSLRYFFSGYKSRLQSIKDCYLGIFWDSFVTMVGVENDKRLGITSYTDAIEQNKFKDDDEAIATVVQIVGEKELKRILYDDADYSNIFNYDFRKPILNLLREKRIPDDEFEKISDWLYELIIDDILELFESYQAGEI